MGFIRQKGMAAVIGCRRKLLTAGGLCSFGLTCALAILGMCADSNAGSFRYSRLRKPCSAECCDSQHAGEEPGGSWYWLRSPEQERRVVGNLYNRYCIRCHATDGRGVWDMPDVPDFTSQRWQESRSDGQLTRLILEGRGAVMPAFRGTLTLEEAWAMSRYLRTFSPKAVQSRPGSPELEHAGTGK